MGYRFRKSFRLGPLRINLSKSGVGYSMGNKFVRYTKKANGGTRVTTTLPGTGISHVSETSSRSRSTPPAQCGVTSSAPGKTSVSVPAPLALTLAAVIVIAVISLGLSPKQETLTAETRPPAKAEVEETMPIDFSPFADCFAAAYPDAAISYLDNSGTPQITVAAAGYSSDAQPQGWDDEKALFSGCLAAADEIAKNNGYKTALAQLEAGDGEILLSGYNGALKFDLFAQRAADQAEQKIESVGSSSADSRTVYVTPTGSKYHYSSSCNGGSYTATTLDNALARGLSACKKCA